MKLRKTVTGAKGYEQLDRGESLADLLGDPGSQPVEALTGLGGDQHRLGVAEGQLSALLLIE